MKSDRELLEPAAKAAGVELWLNSVSSYRNGANGPTWNSLTDDGDCARMESACEIDVQWFRDAVMINIDASDGECIEYFANHNGDKNAARRLASTRAAAQIGEGMK